MRQSSKLSEPDEGLGSIIEKAERRIMIKVQVISLLILMFFSFLSYVMYFMIKTTNSTTTDLTQWYLQALERINVLEKYISNVKSNNCSCVKIHRHEKNP